MTDARTVLGVFPDEKSAVSAVWALKKTPWTVKTVYSPVPSPEMAAALPVRPSRVGYFTLVGGILGFFLGFALAAYTSLQWKLIVGGKPVVALVPFFIVGFEFTILFAVIGNVAGLIHQMKLPDYKALKNRDPRCTGRHFGVAAVCPGADVDKLTEFLQQKGAETRMMP